MFCKRPVPDGGQLQEPSLSPRPAQRCRALDTWELSLGLPSSLQGLATSPGLAPFAPRAPNQEEAARPAQNGQLRAPFHPQISAGSGTEFFPFQTSPHPWQLPHNLYLSLLPRRQARDTKKKKRKKEGETSTTLPGPILQSGAGMKKRKNHTFSPPPHPNSVTRADPGSRIPEEEAEGKEVRLEEAETRRGELARARERRKYPTKPR